MIEENRYCPTCEHETSGSTEWVDGDRNDPGEYQWTCDVCEEWIAWKPERDDY